MELWVRRFLSADDLWSVGGYILLTVLARVANPLSDVAIASAFASAMLAIFWLVAQDVRKRNADRRPNARVVVWGIVAAVSLWVALGQ